MNGRKPKLTENQQAEAIKLYAETKTPVREIAAQFGVSREIINQIARKAYLAGKIERRGTKPAPRKLSFTVPAHIGEILAAMPDATPSAAARRVLIETLSK